MFIIHLSSDAGASGGGRPTVGGALPAADGRPDLSFINCFLTLNLYFASWPAETLLPVAVPLTSVQDEVPPLTSDPGPFNQPRWPPGHSLSELVGSECCHGWGCSVAMEMV